MALVELQRFAAVIAQDVFEVLSLKGSVALRDHIGGTAPRQVREAIKRARLKI
jgi:argininosuccinate lyase